MTSDQKLDVKSLTHIRDRIYERYRSRGVGAYLADDRECRAPYLRHLIRKHVPPCREVKILDLGCGSGTLIYFLREAGYHCVSGVDCSPEQVAAARDLGIEGIREADLGEVLRTLDGEAVDVVIAFDVIEHMTKPELLAFADEVYRVLRTGGRWILHAPNAEALFGSRVRYADWTHEQAFTKESLEQLLRTVGFKEIHCYEDEPVIHGFKSFIRWLTWKAVRSVLRVCWLAETGGTGRDGIFSQNLLAVAGKE
ncbi:MAG: class I SAM-dependent methyltransferase [Nitrospirae bacterium]|nr:class I SAM-dependent methyltransferase [Nitrospirota bacterium]